MKKFKDYIFLHLNILLFSFTGVFTKLAALAYNDGGLWNFKLFFFLGLMFLNCAVYAVVWQRMIKRFDLSFAFANRSVYLIWAQLWALFIFKESLSVRNIIGMLIVLIGVLIVQMANAREEKEAQKS